MAKTPEEIHAIIEDVQLLLMTYQLSGCTVTNVSQHPCYEGERLLDFNISRRNQRSFIRTLLFFYEDSARIWLDRDFTTTYDNFMGDLVTEIESFLNR